MRFAFIKSIKSLVRICCIIRPGWERPAMALARAHTRHIKNTRVVCHRPNILYPVLPHLFPIHSFWTLLITLFTIAIIKCPV